MTAVVRGDALNIPLRDKSVNLIVTSPPYFALRSYRDDGEHYDGQIGSEPTPQAFLEALWAVTKECWRVLADDGVMFVNLGDKRSGSGGHNNASLVAPGNKHAKAARSMMDGDRVIDPNARRAQWTDASGAISHSQPDSVSGVATSAVSDSLKSSRRNAPDRYNQAAFGRPKSKMALPHRYFIGCEDGLADPCVKDHEHVGRHPAYIEKEMCRGIGWIARQDIVWSKPNGLPESVTDRVRDSHEYWFHLTKSERYFAAVDEVREPHQGIERPNFDGSYGATPKASLNGMHQHVDRAGNNPLGKLPGSVWTIPSEPLVVPEWLGVDHFAAFPQEWPRRLILGWSPSGICTACREGRRPVVAKEGESTYARLKREGRLAYGNVAVPGVGQPGNVGNTFTTDGKWPGYESRAATITGYACACPTPNAPTRPAVVLDPFGGTGTTAMVARALGRTGVSLDLSADYCRLAKWRIFESGHAAKARERTNRENQGSLL